MESELNKETDSLVTYIIKKKLEISKSKRAWYSIIKIISFYSILDFSK